MSNDAETAAQRIWKYEIILIASSISESKLETVKDFFRKKERPELAENSGEVMSLEAWLHELRSARPMSEKETLEEALREAIKREDYEKAAECRDALRNLVSAPKQNT